MSDINIETGKKKKEKNKFKILWTLLLIPIGVAMLLLTRLSPELTEIHYSAQIYPYLVEFISTLTGWIPFSVAEALIFFIPLVLIIFIFNAIIYSKKENRREKIKIIIARIIAGVSVIFFLFVLLSGINYNRVSFMNYLNLKIEPSSSEELSNMCKEFIKDANSLRYRMDEDEKGVTRLTYESTYEMANAASEAYALLGKDYPILGGVKVLPKPVVLSELMSYAQITGIYSPYTMEANYNSHSPDYSLPATLCHEITHVKGFMREDEANFIAYLACKKSIDPQVIYSGVMLALVHSMNELYTSDYNLFLDRYEEYSEGVSKDFNAYSEYWNKYEGIVAEISDKVNDSYLKANNQAEGVKSYGRMVDLLLAEHRAKHK